MAQVGRHLNVGDGHEADRGSSTSRWMTALISSRGAHRAGPSSQFAPPSDLAVRLRSAAARFRSDFAALLRPGLTLARCAKPSAC
jgi:hypothetical protein